MLTIIFTIIFALAFGCLMLWLNRINNSPARTLAGRRFMFVISIIIGALLYQTTINLFWVCNQTSCHYTWHDTVTKGIKK